jgi:signal transduction histidine kinase
VEMTRSRWGRRSPAGQEDLRDSDLGEIAGSRECLELREVFTNLLFNAVDAIHGEGPSVSTRQVADKVRVVVADDGEGMSPEVQRRLDPFFTTKVQGRAWGRAWPMESPAATGPPSKSRASSGKVPSSAWNSCLTG